MPFWNKGIEDSPQIEDDKRAAQAVQPPQPKEGESGNGP